MLGQRQQAQLDAGGKTARIGHVLAMADGTAVQFGQTIDEIMVVALQAVVHAQVDDLQVFGHVMAFHELARIAMRRTEEQYVDRV